MHLEGVHSAKDLLSPGVLISLCALGFTPLALRFGLRFAGVLKPRS
jgi:hypothetical protein